MSGTALPPAFTLRDFNRDGQVDVLLQSDETGQVAAWYLTGSKGAETLGTAAVSKDGTAWKLVASGDFNTDGHNDIVIQHVLTRKIVIVYRNGPAMTSQPQSLSYESVPGWTVMGAADLNRDLHPDLILQHDETGRVGVWFLGGPLGHDT